MKIDGSKSQQGFFGVLGAGATIKNLIIDSSCTITSTDGATLAAFAGVCNLNGTITFENCGNEANVTGKKQNNAAFLGCNYGATTLVFNNCYNTGKISGGWENGAFCGWCGGGATFNNCYNIGEVTEGETWARGTKSMSNCYQTVGNDNGVTKVTTDQVESGELCFKLNGDQSVIAWYQNLTDVRDSYPVPFATGHKRVYANGEMNCDGTAKAGGTLTYGNESESIIPQHEYENGFCKNCGKYKENAMAATDGWYEVSEPWQLRWMARSVIEHNDIYGTANIKLTADIDYTAYKSELFGKDQSTAFKGVFDGQGHKVTIDVVNDGTSRTGLFAYIKAATIKNLVVEGSATSAGPNCVGGLGGRSDGDGTLIENVIVKTAVSYTGNNTDATCGGFFANMEGQVTLKNCAFYGSINTGTAEGNGGLVGWAGSGSNNKYINCIVAPAEYTKNGNSAEFARNNPATTNCYYTSQNDATLESGELAYKLGEAFSQEIGKDAYPVFGSAPVSYVGEEGYATMFDTSTGYELNGDVKAYVATLNNGKWLKLAEVESVPASTPVILKGTYYNKVDAVLPALNQANDLVGTEVATVADGSQYVLAKPEGEELGFYQVTADTTIPAGKAIFISKNAGVKAFFFAEEGTTAINSLTPALSEGEGAIYNMAGQRVSKLQKGINIVNGKKILF
jgi:hypothetical protein